MHGNNIPARFTTGFSDTWESVGVDFFAIVAVDSKKRNRIG
jgi:hypothetical protein